jgi:hypothetical protein
MFLAKKEKGFAKEDKESVIKVVVLTYKAFDKYSDFWG